MVDDIESYPRQAEPYTDERYRPYSSDHIDQQTEDILDYISRDHERKNTGPHQRRTPNDPMTYNYGDFTKRPIMSDDISPNVYNKPFRLH